MKFLYLISSMLILMMALTAAGILPNSKVLINKTHVIADGQHCSNFHVPGDQLYYIDGECLTEDKATESVSRFIENDGGSAAVVEIMNATQLSSSVILGNLEGTEYDCWRGAFYNNDRNAICETQEDSNLENLVG